MAENMFFSNRSLFGHGNKYLFYVEIGGRGIGKTYSTQNYCLRAFFKRGEKFLWLRLKEPAVKKLLSNNAHDFFESELLEKYHVKTVEVRGDSIYLNGKEACKILALSTFYQTKGVALNKGGNVKETTKKYSEDETKGLIKKASKKYRNIVLDEMNQEKNEKNTMDICYSFVNQLETVCRLDLDRRIILLGNTLSEASDILAGCFNFIPEKFGTYKLKNKRAIIAYIEDSEKYKRARRSSIAGILAPNESTFTNTIRSDYDLVTDVPLGKQLAVIRFNEKTFFVLHSNGIISGQKAPPTLPQIAMTPYIVGLPYYKEKATAIIEQTQTRHFKFDRLVTMKMFYKEIKLLKPG